jgi:hypothetical protein
MKETKLHTTYNGPSEYKKVKYAYQDWPHRADTAFQTAKKK